MRGDKWEWSICAVTTVPYECEKTTTQSSPRSSKIWDIAVQMAALESGGEVMRILMERNSIAKIPTSGCSAMNSSKKGVYGYKPIYTSIRHIHRNC